MSHRFADQVAVVTGGSTGIGFAIAKVLLTDGAKRVYITGRTQKSLDEAVAQLGERIVAVVSDTANIPDLQKLKSEIDARGDRLDALFANAGVADKNTIGDTSEEAFAKIFDINVKGVFFAVQTLLPLLKDGASLVLTGSVAANKGMEQFSLYSASKAAVRSFARSWANDLKTRKIRVNVLSPGLTLTPIFEKSMNMDATQIAALQDYAASAVPLGYMAQPEEIAAAATFLASSEASYINGTELAVDGGFSQI